MEIRKLEDHSTGRQADLTRDLINASLAYYGGMTSMMSDRDFDQKVDALRKMEAESGFVYDLSPTRKVGASVVTDLKKVKHEQPALSLDKVKYKDRENLVSWIKGDAAGAIMSWKMDGSTVVLTFDAGKLSSAVTRGDGVEGSDITHNARFFEGIPETIDYLGHLVLRGEAYMIQDEFERVNAEASGIYENARNLATATIQMLDANESRKRKISFKAFELVSPLTDRTESWDGHTYDLRYMQDRLDWLEVLGFDVVDHECVDETDVLDKIEEWKSDLPNLGYPTDGLVFSYQDLANGWALGSTGHHPRWAIALKWTDETATTTIREIQWSVGKTGVITPVAVFDEVRLGLGSNVTRASLHNLSIMKRLSSQTSGNVRETMIIGSKAEVYLANMIIPNVASITATDETTAAVPPHRCPVCGEPTSIVWNMENDVEVLMCRNHENCPAQQIGRLMNTFGKNGLFIKGLGESQIEDLINTGLVTAEPESFYRLSGYGVGGYRTEHFGVTFPKELSGLKGWGQKKWENLLDAIDASRKTTLQKFLYSLNIPLLGNDLSKKLANYWHGNIIAFISFVEDIALPEGASEATDELCALEGVGDEKAQNIVSWADRMTRKGGWDKVKALIAELDFPKAFSDESDSTLNGMTFVITGSVHEYKNRDEFKASVEARGGKVAGSVSKNTNYLINNDITSTSGKNAKAKEFRIPIISEDEFISRFGK